MFDEMKHAVMQGKDAAKEVAEGADKAMLQQHLPTVEEQVEDNMQRAWDELIAVEIAENADPVKAAQLKKKLSKEEKSELKKILDEIGTGEEAKSEHKKGKKEEKEERRRLLGEDDDVKGALEEERTSSAVSSEALEASAAAPRRRLDYWMPRSPCLPAPDEPQLDAEGNPIVAEFQAGTGRPLLQGKIGSPKSAVSLSLMGGVVGAAFLVVLLVVGGVLRISRRRSQDSAVGFSLLSSRTSIVESSPGSETPAPPPQE